MYPRAIDVTGREPASMTIRALAAMTTTMPTTARTQRSPMREREPGAAGPSAASTPASLASGRLSAGSYGDPVGWSESGSGSVESLVGAPHDAAEDVVPDGVSDGQASVAESGAAAGGVTAATSS